MSRRRVMGALTVLILVLAAAPLTAAGVDGFTDIDGNEHAAAIERVAALGITMGCNPPENDRYCPDALVTRGQMAAFLGRALGLPSAGPQGFTDTAGNTFAHDIDRLAAAGITRGCNPPTNDRFCPDATVTRGQMAAFLVRAMGATADTLPKFTDTVGHTFQHDIAVLAAFEVTRGCNPPTNSRFCPDSPVSRDQMATFLDRVHQLIFGGPSGTPPPPPSTTSSTSPTSSSTTTTSAPPTTTTTIPKSGAFLEKNGVVVMEVESAVDVNPWTEGTGFGAVGSYYVVPGAGTFTPGTGVLTYEVWITEPGVYVATVRARRDLRETEQLCSDLPTDPPDTTLPPDTTVPPPPCVENGQRNDIFIRMDFETWDARIHKGTTHAAFGNWGWVDKWREVEGPSSDCAATQTQTCFRAFNWDLEPGLHTFQISRRAEQLKIDRIFLYRTDANLFDLEAVQANRPHATNTPESPRQP